MRWAKLCVPALHTGTEWKSYASSTSLRRRISRKLNSRRRQGLYNLLLIRSYYHYFANEIFNLSLKLWPLTPHDLVDSPGQ